MSGSLAIAYAAKREAGKTVVIFKEDFNESTMIDISSKFFNEVVITNYLNQVVIIPAPVVPLTVPNPYKIVVMKG